MRTYVVFGAAAFSLAACGGGGAGPETVGGVAAPGTTNPVEFVTPTEPRTFVGVGGIQRYDYSTDGRNCCNQQGQSYGGVGTRVRDSSIAITYDPRDATYIMKVTDQSIGIQHDVRFQDPANRTNFGGAQQPQWGTPDLSKAGQYANSNIQYLQAGDGTPTSMYQMSGSGFIDYGGPDQIPDGNPGSGYQASSFFFEKPGTSTKYVTFAGYIRNELSFSEIQPDPESDTTFASDAYKFERGAFAYGVFTDNNAVPTSGSATFTGNMLATMVYNPLIDAPGKQPTYFQWLTGNSTTTVNFSNRAVQLALEGVVLAPQIDRNTSPTTAYIPAGSTFTASGSATIDLVQKGGFVGGFENGHFTFTTPAGATLPNGQTTEKVNIIGSSIDGAFFGPNAEEVGGGFRVVGGTPDQRIDILGAFKGRK